MATTRKKTVAKKDDDLLLDSTGAQDVPDIDGHAFRWVNLAKRSRTGWGIWRAVTKNTDVHQKVQEFFDRVHFQQFGGTKEDSEYIFGGPGLVLAYAPIELVEKRREHMQNKADEQLRLIMEQHGSTGKLRYVTVPTEPTD